MDANTVYPAFVCLINFLHACPSFSVMSGRAFLGLTSTTQGIICISGFVWYLIVSIPDLCTLTYFAIYHLYTNGFFLLV